jgi:DNA-binding transcriptional MocR family regulator
MHLWMQLPEPWSNEDFVSAAEREGVLLCSANAFAAGPEDSTVKAVRICLGAASSADELDGTLTTIADLTVRGPVRQRTVAV